MKFEDAGQQVKTINEVTYMQDTGIKPIVIEEICQIAKRYDIKKVILFGSRARGNYHRASDIDLAVLGGNVARFADDVREDTSTLLQYDIIDLEQTLSEELLQSINKEGMIVYEKI